MRALTTLVLLFTCLLVSAQVEVNNGWMGRFGNRVKGNGEVTTKSYDIDGFSRIRTCCSFKVEVREGNFDVKVEAESNLQKFIELRTSGGTLKISYVDNANFKSTKPIRVYVSLPELEGIDASSSSRVIGMSAFSGDDLELDVSSSAVIEVEFSGDEVDIDASSSGRVEVKGTANKVTADASSASRIDAGELKASRGDADVNSAANITLNVSKSLKADASSAGSVRYYGNPSDVVTDTSSAGSVRSKN